MYMYIYIYIFPLILSEGFLFSFDIASLHLLITFGFYRLLLATSIQSHHMTLVAHDSHTNDSHTMTVTERHTASPTQRLSQPMSCYHGWYFSTS